MTTCTVDDDGTLLTAWHVRRDEASFQGLCTRHATQVAAACRRQGSPDADEATQAVFLILARRAGSVAGSSLAGWLNLTARRVVAHQHRGAARRRRHEQEAAMEHVRQQAAVVPEADWAEVRQHLDAALASLSPGRREAVLRFHLLGMSQVAVAAELGCSVDAVKTRVHEGLLGMRAFLARRGVGLGVVALTAGLASESVANEPALAAACTQTALAPANAPAAATLATGTLTAMYIKTASFAAALILVGTCLTAALSMAGEAPPAVIQPLVSTTVAAPLDPAANAALDWWRAIDSLPKEGEPIWKLADDYGSRLPDPVADAMFGGGYCRPLDLLTLGAANPYCAWGVDVAQEGASALLPYLGKMRSLIRLGILRARWHAARDETTAALDDVLVCLRTSRLIAGRQPLFMDFLTGLSLEIQAINAAGSLAPRLDAGQRQRFSTALARLPAATETYECLGAQIAMMRAEIGRLLNMPPAERFRAVRMLASNTINLPDEFDAMRLAVQMSDTGLKACLDALTVEVARWNTLLRLPSAERVRKMAPFTTGEQPPHPLMILFTDIWPSIGLSEVRLLLLREQLLTALDYLDRGEAGLTAHRDVLTGKPFRFQKTAGGFLLSADIPGEKRGAKLMVGEAPAPAPGGPATGGMPSDF